MYNYLYYIWQEKSYIWVSLIHPVISSLMKLLFHFDDHPYYYNAIMSQVNYVSHQWSQSADESPYVPSTGAGPNKRRLWIRSAASPLWCCHQEMLKAIMQQEVMTNTWRMEPAGIGESGSGLNGMEWIGTEWFRVDYIWMEQTEQGLNVIERNGIVWIRVEIIVN